MKRTCLCIVMLLVFAFSASAQTDCQCITPDTFIKLIEENRPGVVSINLNAMMMTMRGPMIAPKYGTGFAVSCGNGLYIVTNKHVISGATGQIKMKTNDGDVFNLEVVKLSEISDLAILRPVKGWDDTYPSDLKILTLGDSDQIMAGEFVMAIGNPHGLGGSCAQGIVSNKNREVKHPDSDYPHNYIQIDVATNPGNSGGPLLNLRGEVVGVVTLATGIGIGSAIPVNIVKEEIALLEGNPAGAASGWLGLDFVAVEEDILEAYGHSSDINGFIITRTAPDSPAHDILEQGDVVTHINGEAVNEAQGIDSNGLKRKILGLVPGEKVVLTVIKPGQMPSEIEITVETKPAEK